MQSVLVVEDDSNLREVLCILLNLQGMNHIPAQNGVEALELYAKHKIDLVVTDFNMPQMKGGELILNLKAKDHNLPIVFFSAAHESQTLLEVLRFPRIIAMKKPMSPELLARAIEQVKEMPPIVFSQQRRFLRVPFEATATLGPHGKATLKNIALGGTFIETKAEIPTSQTFPLRFSPPKDPRQTLHLQASVQWKKPGVGYGVAFSAMPESVCNTLKKLVLSEVIAQKTLWLSEE